MRLFRRYTADTSPQLVSAVPISQDVAAANNNAEGNTSERSEKKSKANDRLEGALPAKADTGSAPKESTDSSILTRKGRTRNKVPYHRINVAQPRFVLVRNKRATELRLILIDILKSIATLCPRT